ncbi:hypothetical protein G7Z17_g1925 [Cylindrodendrum hubeiense]|uniref:Uncharacterized protein n=1 Tax=Cylindrodendrum hubeiense TaxID=595255 RepID=A0A9P5HDV9_9HYPO|nr:hypothetical protein G7Z17_g1925 [Cylindrodendrum hubeiense]
MAGVASTGATGLTKVQEIMLDAAMGSAFDTGNYPEDLDAMTQYLRAERVPEDLLAEDHQTVRMNFYIRHCNRALKAAREQPRQEPVARPISPPYSSTTSDRPKPPEPEPREYLLDAAEQATSEEIPTLVPTFLDEVSINPEN